MSNRYLKSSVSSVIDYLAQQQCYGIPSLNMRLMRYKFGSFKTLYRRDLFAHYGCVNAIEFSDDGEWLVSGGDDKRVLIWNVDQSLSRFPKPKAMKGEHNSNIFCLSFDSAHAKLFSAGNDEQVIMHDVTSGETMDVFLHDEAVYGLSVDPRNDNIFASACDDGRILLWDTRASTTDAFMLAGSNSAFHAVMHNPAVPALLVTANAKEGVGLWDVRKPRYCVVRYGSTVLSQSAMSVRFNSLGTHILALRRRLPPVLYELHSVHPVAEFDHKEYYNSCTMKSCCFAGDNDQYILSGSDDFKLYMWKIPESISEQKGMYVRDAHVVLRGHRSIVNQVRCNKYYGLLASSGVEKIIKLWTTFPVGEQADSDYGADGLRKVYTHEEYINLVLESGQFMTHDYSHHSVQEDPRMMAFFDSLVQRDIEGWTSDSSETSIPASNTCFEVQSSLSSSSVSTSDSSDDEADQSKADRRHRERSSSPRDYREQVTFSMTLPPPDFSCRLDDDNRECDNDMTSERISRLIAKKRSDQMRKTARMSKRLKTRLKQIKESVKRKSNGAVNLGNRQEIFNNAKRVLNSAVRNRLDKRKVLMRKRAKLMRTLAMGENSSDSDSSNDGDGDDDAQQSCVNNCVAMDLSIGSSFVPVQSAATGDEKPSSLNGSVPVKSNGSIENSTPPKDSVSSVPETSSSVTEAPPAPLSSPPPLPPPLPLPPPPPPPPVSLASNSQVLFQPKSGKHHSRNYRKRSADDSQDD